MEKQELKSKWDELAREIGAEIPPETQQREEAISTTTDQDAPQQSRATQQSTIVRPPLPKRPAGWDSLAGEFGLPVVEPPLPTPEVPPPTPAQRPPAPVQRQPTRETPSRPPKRQRHEDREPSGERREPRGPRRRGPEKPREQRNREAAPDKRGPARERSADRADEFPSPEPPKAESPLPPAPVAAPEQPAKAPALSLWHKIFGSPAEQTAKLVETSSDDIGPDESSPSRSESAFDVTSSTIRSLSGEDVAAAEFIGEDQRGDDRSTAEDGTSPGQGRRGRPRRRRRGGRGRKPDERRGDGRQPHQRKQEPRGADEFDAEFDDLNDDLGDLTTEGDAFQSEPLDSDVDADESEVDLGAGQAGRSRSAAQRAIPTWDEAIGFIVDSNMQSRSQRRPPSRSDSRGNGPRGRSRGRRKR
jgi:hypothetical protein